MRLLDAFCCSGAASVGYHRAGWDEIVGIDIEPQPNYPFQFVLGDAVAYIREHGREFDAIHASPPCQASCALTSGTNQDNGRDYPQLIPGTRAALESTGRPYVIENVAGADLRKDLRLCGEQFGLSVIRHRFFECGGWTPASLPHRPHRGRVRGWRHGQYFDATEGAAS